MSVPIVDKRFLPKTQSSNSRGKFIDRYKNKIRKNIRDIIIKGSLDGAIKGDRKIKIDLDSTSEPEFGFDYSTGNKDRIYIGNKEYVTGDSFRRPPGGRSKNGGSGQGDEGEDGFEFILTEKEFMDIFFEDLGLPNLLKKEFLGANVEIRHAGLSKEGGPTSLNLRRTFLNAFCRRKAVKRALAEALANPVKRKKVPFIDELDLRYNFKDKVEVPTTKAVMFCLMDVSGSMEECQKDYAKRFFILLNLFLKRNYETVDIVFVRHTDTAEEVDEKTFFYDRRTGGTIISTGYVLIDEIINKRYNPEMWNVYIAQASDGDNFDCDNEEMVKVLKTKLLPVTQYMAYINVGTKNMGFISHRSEVYDIMLRVSKSFKNLVTAEIRDYPDILRVFRELFKKRTS